MDTKPAENSAEQLRHEAEAAAPAMVAEEQIEHAIESRPRKLLTLLLRYLLPLALTVALVWYLFRKIDFSLMLDILREGVDYWWILLAMVLSVFSHIFRAARWKLQLDALDIKVPFMALCCSVFGCYALNLVFPRFGEVWRCTYVAKTSKAPFTTLLGSMVSERLTDTLSVIALTFFTFIVASAALLSFLDEYPVGQDILALAANPFLWLALIGTATVVVCIFYFGRNTPFIRKIHQWIKELWMGFASLWQMKGRLTFLGLTFAIWGTYFVQLYVAFFAFPFTKELCMTSDTAFGLVPALVAFVLGAIGMAVPANGGLGPWNIAVMFGLAVYGVSYAEGTAFSMVQWSGQTLMLIFLGIYTMVYIALSRNKISSNRQQL